jgi:hypothetical protein
MPADVSIILAIYITHPNINSNPISIVPNIDVLDRIKWSSVIMHRTCRIRNKFQKQVNNIDLTESLCSPPNKVPEIFEQ